MVDKLKLCWRTLCVPGSGHSIYFSLLVPLIKPIGKKFISSSFCSYKFTNNFLLSFLSFKSLRRLYSKVINAFKSKGKNISRNNSSRFKKRCIHLSKDPLLFDCLLWVSWQPKLKLDQTWSFRTSLFSVRISCGFMCMISFKASTGKIQMHGSSSTFDYHHYHYHLVDSV